MHRLEAEPEGRRIVQRLHDLPRSARQHFCAAVCEAALRRARLTTPVLVNALPDIRSGRTSKSRQAAVASIVHDLDVTAWDLQDENDAQYEAAFQRARAAAAVEQALITSEAAAVETAYEAHHAGLTLTDIANLLDKLTPQP
jgi:hypothetical protein